MFTKKNNMEWKNFQKVVSHDICDMFFTKKDNNQLTGINGIYHILSRSIFRKILVEEIDTWYMIKCWSFEGNENMCVLLPFFLPINCLTKNNVISWKDGMKKHAHPTNNFRGLIGFAFRKKIDHSTHGSQFGYFGSV